MIDYLTNTIQVRTIDDFSIIALALGQAYQVALTDEQAAKYAELYLALRGNAITDTYHRTSEINE